MTDTEYKIRDFQSSRRVLNIPLDFFRSLEFLALESKGCQAVVDFFKLAAFLFENGHGFIPSSAYQLLNLQTNISVFIETKVVEVDDEILIPFVSEQIKQIQKMRQVRRKAGKLGGLAKVANAKQMLSKSLAIASTSKDKDKAKAKDKDLILDLIDDHSKKKDLSREKRHRFGPGGWFLSSNEKMAEMVKAQGQPWVDYWLKAFCEWAQKNPPAASAKIPDHWLTVQQWEQKRIEEEKNFYCGPALPAGYYKDETIVKTLEVQNDSN